MATRRRATPTNREDDRVGQYVRVAAFLLSLGVAWTMGPYAGGSDSSGYLSSARLLSRGTVDEPLPALAGHPASAFGEGAFQPLGFTIVEGAARMQPRYPMGLPLHLAALAWLTGLEAAARIVNAVAAGAILLMTRRLCLDAGANEWSAAVATLAVVASPLFIFCAIQPMSDLLATAWALAAIVCGLRGRESGRWAAAAGAAVGLAVLVRPTNVLLVAPVGLALGLDWRRLAAAAAGGLPAAVFLLAFNRIAYGHPFEMGYGDQVATAFNAAFLGANLPAMASRIPLLLTPLVLLVLAAPFRQAGRSRVHGVLWLWVAALGISYGFYVHTGEAWWYLRFLLPIFPALVALAAATAAGPVLSARRREIAIGLLVTVAAWQWQGSQRLDVLSVPDGERQYLVAAEWARRSLPGDSVVFCMQVSGALHYYTDLLIARWDHPYRHRIPRLLDAARAQNRPIYAALHAFEEAPARLAIPGQWVKVGESGATTFWEVRADP